MQQRATKKIIIQDIEFEVKEWITGRESEYINEPIVNATVMKMTVIDGQPAPSLDSFNNKAITESTHRAIESVVVSVSGNKDSILDNILDLKKDIYEEVLKMVDEIVKKK
jgi:hypothetical protein